MEAQPTPFGLIERKLAWQYLRAKRTQGGVTLVASLSLIGISLGVMALIVVTSVMNGFRTELIDRLVGSQGHIILDTRGYPDHEIDNLIQAIRDTDGIARVAPIIEGEVLATANDRHEGALVTAISKADFMALPFINQGEGLLAGDINLFGAGRNGDSGVMIGIRMAMKLGLNVGDYIRLIAPEGAKTPFGVAPREKTYPIIGLIEIGVSELDAKLIFMPLRQGQLYFNKKNQYSMVDIRLVDPQASEDVMGVLYPQIPANMYMVDWKQRNSAFVGALAIERNLMRLVFLVLITITSLNIITGIVMLVKNKARDIAILRTMGASRNAIMRIFLSIGALLGITGTCVGLILGLLFCWNVEGIQAVLDIIFNVKVFDPEVYYLNRIPAIVEWSDVWLVLIWGFVMSILVTIFPAWSAAKLDPVEALRRE